jgi:hypothetical protein
VAVVVPLVVFHMGQEALAVAALLLVVLAPSTPEVVVLEIGHTINLAEPVVLGWLSSVQRDRQLQRQGVQRTPLFPIITSTRLTPAAASPSNGPLRTTQ